MRLRNIVLLAVAAIAAVGASPPAAAQECGRQSATGHVEFIGTAQSNLGRHVQYSFSAVQWIERDANGECTDVKVNGEVEERVYLPDGTLLRHSHGDVVCLSTRPNALGGGKAWFAYRGDRVDPEIPCADPANHPELCITHGAIEVEDNGEGKNAPPDLGSAVLGRTQDAAFLFCAAQPERPLGEVIQGNVQVRP
jgi:hypothetical protein